MSMRQEEVLRSSTESLPKTINAWEQFAKERLPRNSYDYIVRGSGEENTLRANRSVFNDWTVIPRVLKTVTNRDKSIHLLGKTYPTPLLFSPIGVQKIVHPNGELESSKVAAEFGIPFILSTAASCSMDEVAANIGDSPKWFQVYYSKNKEVSKSQIQRAEALGYEALVITVDTVLLGLREYDVENNYSPLKEGMGSGNYISDPVFNELLHAKGLSGKEGAIKFQMEIFENPSLSWDDIIEIKSFTNLPIFLKGVMHKDDALTAVSLGIDGLIVSNHGGRQLDHCISSLEALVNICEAVGGKIPVLFDSGIRRGTDIVKAMAIGATAVLIGRPYLYGMVAGQEGIRTVLQQILRELDVTMALAGIDDIKTIDDSILLKRK
jgi:lactate 2-monooxygenase